MVSELGPEWMSLFSSFDRTPIASASIGQVHRAVLETGNIPVAVKVQFPGIADSISSDFSNLSLLLHASAVLPKGMYLQNSIAVMKQELADECDYRLEADSGARFREFLKNDRYFVVPKIITEATTEKVLTTQWMSGKPLNKVKNMPQDVRDRVRISLRSVSH